MIETGPRRLSNIYPVQSQTYPNIAQKARCALTPTGVGGPQPFFPPTCTPLKVNSLKKPITSSTKMDMFVPSPAGYMNAHFATSPPSSIYDHDRSDLNTFCGSSSLSNPSMDSAISEDICGLDETIEDSSLETFLTPDVMNTLQVQVTGMNNTSDISWGGKMSTDMPTPVVAESLGSNPTLAQLNMEPDMSFLTDIFQDEGKLSYSALDYLCNDINDSSSQSVFTSSLSDSSRTAPIFVSSASDSLRRSETMGSSQVNQKSFEDVGSNYIKNVAPLKSNFPPRASHPQLIGVVAPVIKPETEESTSGKTVDGLEKLKNQSPNLHKLLSKHPQTIVKSEVFSPTDCSALGKVGVSDHSAQIVPTSTASKRTHTGDVKVEPTSPKSTTRILVKEESTEDKWKDIENFLHNPKQETSAKRRRCDSGSSGHTSDDDDDEDGASSYGVKEGDDDSDDDYSDIDDDLAHILPGECESLIATGKKQKQYFWQYNVQSKGPKGTRLKLAVDSPTDPHVLNDFEDPVFDECNTAIAGIRHGGKARKGDGNEITPNPKKLFMIGHQLMRLNRQINACQLGADVPAAKRNESRKEKNKLASRACRLKKKAQHEANKIKLYGLEQEHSQLNSVLRLIWPHIRDRAKALLDPQSDKSSLSSTSASLTSMLEGYINQNLKSMIGGHTTDYVNSVILKVESGDNSGGLNLRKSHKT